MSTEAKGFGFLSGLPERRRKARWLLALQAMFDDSGCLGAGRFMVMAGLMGRAETISHVADEWDKHLRARHPGAIRRFKMDDAMRAKGEFAYWKADNIEAKVKQMARIIDRSDLLQVSAVIDLDAFKEVAVHYTGVKAEKGSVSLVTACPLRM